MSETLKSYKLSIDYKKKKKVEQSDIYSKIYSNIELSLAHYLTV